MQSSPMGFRPLRLPLVMAVVVIIAVFATIDSSGAGAQQSPEQELAEKYSPILMLKTQTKNCDTKGEGYFPTTVDWLMGNPDVALKARAEGKAKNDPVIMMAPTAQDLANAGEATYLDFPGEPRNPACTFETYFKQKAAELGLEPTVYVKYTYEPIARRLYLQYWYYFYYNDWNDTHESDWEMFALGFNAETPAEALNMEPSWVGFAQHGGGETADWNGTKLQREGNHPIAYLSANSHATYYSSDTMIGWGENGTAFGCDVTEAPSTEIRPNVVVIPDNIDPNGPFAWALYPGRWGQRDVAMFAGPVGPNMGKKWNDPATAFGDWRPTVLKVPGSNAVGINTTDIFCGLSGFGSRTFVYFGSHPWSVSFLVVTLLAVLGVSVWRVWPFFMEALDIYGRGLRTFLGIGALTLPIGGIFHGVRTWAEGHPPLSWISLQVDGAAGGGLMQALFLLLFQQIVMVLLVTPAIICAVREMRAGYRPGVLSSFRAGLKYAPSLALSVVTLFVVLSFASWLVLIPVVIYVLVRFQFYSQATIIDGERGWKPPLARSWRVTKGQWIKTFSWTLAFQLLGALPGPLIGVVLMVIGGTNVRFANFISSFLYAVFIPLSVIGITIAYRRMKGEHVIEPYVILRERDPKKAAAAEAAVAAAMAESAARTA